MFSGTCSTARQAGPRGMACAMPLSLMQANRISFHNDLTFFLPLQILVEYEVCSSFLKMCIWIIWDLKLKFLIGLQITQCPSVQGIPSSIGMKASAIN